MEMLPPLRPLQLKDRSLFESYFHKIETPLSAYHLSSHYIWSRAFQYLWTVKNDVLYLFAGYDGLFYMPIPPLGRLNARAIESAFAFMRTANRNPAASRIEQIAPSEVPLFQDMGYELRPGFSEYLYRREDLADLRGSRYKSQRADYNYFVGHADDVQITPFHRRDQETCLALLSRWRQSREARYTDPYYRALLKDAYAAHRLAMRHQRTLGLVGRVLKIKGCIHGYTFGFPRGTETFCILLEIADPACKGLSTYLFREFCREMMAYRIINTLDDSGLSNLRKAKLSYHPWKLITPFTAAEKR